MPQPLGEALALLILALSVLAVLRLSSWKQGETFFPPWVYRLAAGFAANTRLGATVAELGPSHDATPPDPEPVAEIPNVRSALPLGVDWYAVRSAFEHDEPPPTLAELARRFGVRRDAVAKHRDGFAGEPRAWVRRQPQPIVKHAPRRKKAARKKSGAKKAAPRKKAGAKKSPR